MMIIQLHYTLFYKPPVYEQLALRSKNVKQLSEHDTRQEAPIDDNFCDIACKKSAVVPFLLRFRCLLGNFFKFSKFQSLRIYILQLLYLVNLLSNC